MKQKERERASRNKNYAIKSVVHGISLLMGNQGSGPLETRTKTTLKKLKFLNDSTVSNLKKNNALRNSALSKNIGLFNSDKINLTVARRFRLYKEDSFIETLQSYIDKNEQDRDLIKGLDILGFAADYRVRFPATDMNIENFVRFI